MSSTEVKDVLQQLGLEAVNPGACGKKWYRESARDELVSVNPATGEPIASVLQANDADFERVMADAEEAFKSFRMMPAPQRGMVVHDMTVALTEYKEPLGALVSIEMGKILSEGLGEVQEMIDIGHLAVGLSRQLYGLTTHSERPLHRMYEQWHPYGTIGIISAFNFPVAVWAWNALIAAACGDTSIWKPSSSTPLTAVATQNIVNRVLEKHGLQGIMTTVIGKGSVVGEQLINDERIPLVSFTGSTRMGKRVGEVVGGRLGNTILELGGNNCIIVAPSANLDMAMRSILFGAVGTAGQRCTSTRRVIMHKSVATELTDKLVATYPKIRIGNPLDPNTLMGPLVDQSAVDTMMAALAELRENGAEILCGGEVLNDGEYAGGHFVTPSLVKASNDLDVVQRETFAPILYLMEYDEIDEAIAMHNNVPQGLSSAIFSNNLLETEAFLSHRGSDCGIANVNIGTSGAEIGLAFGGEKETGGGRESGSDAWKAYMRRQSNTINWGTELPLAQGVKFDV